jgi:hypothetical protein
MYCTFYSTTVTTMYTRDPSKRHHITMCVFNMYLHVYNYVHYKRDLHTRQTSTQCTHTHTHPTNQHSVHTSIQDLGIQDFPVQYLT